LLTRECIIHRYLPWQQDALDRYSLARGRRELRVLSIFSRLVALAGLEILLQLFRHGDVRLAIALQQDVRCLLIALRDVLKAAGPRADVPESRLEHGHLCPLTGLLPGAGNQWHFDRADHLVRLLAQVILQVGDF
jgi:hypothetical protein